MDTMYDDYHERQVTHVYVTDTSQRHPTGTAAVFIGKRPIQIEKLQPQNDISQELVVQEGSTAGTIDNFIRTEQIELLKTTAEKPNDYRELSAIACFVNFIFGIIALGCALRSQEAWQKGDPKEARGMGYCALFCSLLAIISAVVAIVFVCCWFFL